MGTWTLEQNLSLRHKIVGEPLADSLSVLNCADSEALCLILKESLVRRNNVGIHLLQVRVWELQPPGHRLLETLKGHKAAVACIKIRGDDKECVSASCEGACIIWDIV